MAGYSVCFVSIHAKLSCFIAAPRDHVGARAYDYLVLSGWNQSRVTTDLSCSWEDYIILYTKNITPRHSHHRMTEVRPWEDVKGPLAECGLKRRASDASNQARLPAPSHLPSALFLSPHLAPQRKRSRQQVMRGYSRHTNPLSGN